MVHHDVKILAFRQVDQFFCLLGAVRERLFDEYVLASSKCVHTGVTIATASMSFEVTTSAESAQTRTLEYAFSTRLRELGLLSHTIATWE
jgi:hypothetical protein